MTRSAPPTAPAQAPRRRPLLGLLRGTGLLLAVLLGPAAGAAAFVGALLLARSLPVAALMGLLALVLVTYGSTLGALRGTARARSRAVAAAGVLAVLVAVLAGTTVLRPDAHSASIAVAAPGTSSWDLPDGTRISYTHTPAAALSGRPPVVFLHGGPGIPGEPGGPVLSGPAGLARDGFDVYVYDQIGAGLSSRLPDANDYTADRHVADLELVRQRIGAEELVLVGHSWGAVLAARYLAAHPDRVAKVVLEAPGELWLPAQARRLAPGADATTPEQDALQQRLLTPRLIAVTLLSQLDPQAARTLAGDEEMDGFLLDSFPLQPSPTCDPAAGLQPPAGAGYYVNVATNASLAAVPDPRPALRALPTPALVLAPECDYLDPSLAQGYRDALPASRLVRVPGAGHVIQHDQPALLLDTVRAFLLDRPLPLPAS